MPTAVQRADPRWRLAPIFPASAALHAASLGVVALHPHTWPWALATVVGNHALLAAVGLVPRSQLLGPNMVRLPASAAARREIAITFDDGPDPEITPRVLDCLDSAGVKASFFVVGERVLRYPHLVREIHRRGHSVENHTMVHSLRFSLYGSDHLFSELSAAQSIIAEACGSRPRYFRAPCGLRGPLLDRVLARLDLQLVSWTRRGLDTVARTPEPVLARLAHRAGAGDILLLHDGIAVLEKRNHHVLTVLPRLIDACRMRGLRPVTMRAACDVDPA
ncbi:MAG: polysaccharide deacetylase family protein [Burkholderiales bacterium]